MNKVWTAFNFITPNTSYKTKLGNIHNFKEWALRNLAEREFLAKDLKELEMVEEIYRGRLH